jgi:ferric-dicitrate binding protein FerR (iron transport regulator)
MSTKQNKSDLEHIDQLIFKYTEGKITDDEMHLLENWVGESPANQKYYIKLRNLLDNSKALNVNPGVALEKVLERIFPRKQAGRLIPMLIKLAAVLFIPLLISSLVLLNNFIESKQEIKLKWITLKAPFGSVSSFYLDDGSKVWLNAGSEIRFPDKFSTSDRIVKLSGEAYFEVKSNPATPFIVETDRFSVKATGTRFNVMSYPGQKPSVTLAEGFVNVILQHDNQVTGNIQLKPDQHLSFDPETTLTDIEQGDAYKHYSWKDGKLIFRNDQMADIMQRISLQYNVDIEIFDKSLLQNRYRATFEDELLTDMLDLLKLASPFQYREIPQVKLPDGSYTRKRIIINSSTSR